jgi:hypothetical protein
MKEADKPELAQADNRYAEDQRDDEKSARFADIMRRLDEIDVQLGQLKARQRLIRAELDSLGGLKPGDTVLLEDGRRARLNKVQAEPFIARHGDLMYLRISGECSPLTASGEPNKREVHKRFRHVRWNIEAPISKVGAGPADDTSEGDVA